MPKVFISYASKDQESFVQELAAVLSRRRLAVFYADLDGLVGESIEDRVNREILSCDYGVPVLSSGYFEGDWTKNELSALRGRMRAGDIDLMPITHGISAEDVAKADPLLGTIKSIDSALGPEGVASKLLRRIYPPELGEALDIDFVEHPVVSDGGRESRSGASVSWYHLKVRNNSKEAIHKVCFEVVGIDPPVELPHGHFLQWASESLVSTKDLEPEASALIDVFFTLGEYGDSGSELRIQLLDGNHRKSYLIRPFTGSWEDLDMTIRLWVCADGLAREATVDMYVGTWQGYGGSFRWRTMA